MKKKIIALLGIAITLTSCSLGKDYDEYYSDVPLDLEYSATLYNRLETLTNDDPDKKDVTTNLYAVSQKTTTIAGTTDLATYVEWRQIGVWYNYDHLVDTSYTYLHFKDKTFALNDENKWVEQEKVVAYEPYQYISRYSNITDSDSFRYKMTANLFLRKGALTRHLYHKYKTATTSEYIEYVCPGDEIFRVSNDKYNVCLKYYFDTKLGSIENQVATWEVGSKEVPHLSPDGTTNGAKTSEIPYLDTITKEMLN